MAKLPTYEEMVKKVGKEAAEEALDGYIYKGKTLREWIELLAQTRWIPVSERLPEWHWETYDGEKVWDGERVLACVKEADEYYDLVGVVRYGPDGWESEDEGFCSCLASIPVIAWMPLPKPYEEENEVQK